MQRGWKHEGDLYNFENNVGDWDDLQLIITRNHPTTKLPKRAFYVAVDDREVRKLTHLPSDCGDSYRVSGFPGADPACYKTAVAKAMKGQPFIPESFCLPDESK